MAVGDVMLAQTIGKRIKSNGLLAPWKGVVDYFDQADLVVANLECTISTRGTPWPKVYTFRAPPRAAASLAAAGIDVVSLANNHALDYGVTAFEDTLDLLRLGRIALTDDVLYCVMSAHSLLVKILASKGAGEFAGEIEALRENLAQSHVKKARPKEEISKELISVLTEYEEHRLRECLREGQNIFIVNVKFPITSFDKGYVALTELLKTEAEVIATLPSTKTSHEVLYFDILIGTKKDRPFITDLIKNAADADIRVLSEPASKPTQSIPTIDEMKEHGPQSRETLRRVSNTVRVNIAKLDHIMNIISDLGILKSSIAALGAELKNERELSVYGIELSRAEKTLERKLSELRDSVLDVRMVPIGQLFGRFDTFLGKLARESGKEVRVVTHGDETELDKLIVEELVDPLMHLVRNAFDHAIEPADERRAASKPALGEIRIEASQRGNHVEDSFDALGEAAQQFHLALRQRPVKTLVHLRRLMHLVRLYGRPDVVAAIARANEYQTFDAAYVETLLLQERRRRELPSPTQVRPQREELLEETDLDDPDPGAYDRFCDDHEDQELPKEKQDE